MLYYNKVSKEVNRKCPPRNTTVSTAYSDPDVTIHRFTDRQTTV